MLHRSMMISCEWQNSQKFQVIHDRFIPCAQVDVDEEKVVF